MQRTVNYDLCQYEGSDKTSYLINYNGDMLKIDTAIKGAKDAADNAQSKANTADGKADANALSISTLDTQINGAGGVAADVSSLQGSVNTINSLIGSGEPTTTDKTIIGAINEIAAEIPSGELAADHVTYVNTQSGLTADDVQGAIDEVVSMIPSVVTPDADDVSYDNTQSGLSATNVQAAIDEIAAGEVWTSETVSVAVTKGQNDVAVKTFSTQPKEVKLVMSSPSGTCFMLHLDVENVADSTGATYVADGLTTSANNATYVESLYARLDVSTNALTASFGGGTSANASYTVTKVMYR